MRLRCIAGHATGNRRSEGQTELTTRKRGEPRSPREIHDAFLTAHFLMVLGGTARIAPYDALIGTASEEVRTLPVPVTSEPAIRMADDYAASVIKIARDVTAPSRQVVDDSAPVVVPSEERGGIGHRLVLELINKGDHPCRRGLGVGPAGSAKSNC